MLAASIPVALNFGPPLLIVTLSNLTSFLVAKVKSFPFCVISMLSPASNLTVSPFFTSSTEGVLTVPVDAVDVTFHAELFIAFATSCVVAIPSFPTVPSAPVFPSAPAFPSAPTASFPKFTSYLTTPFGPTVAVVLLPFTKSSPSDNLTVSGAPPFALYLIVAAAPALFIAVFN